MNPDQSTPIRRNWRFPLRCHPRDIDAVMDEARANGYGLRSIQIERGRFYVRFIKVEAYPPTNTTKLCNS